MFGSTPRMAERFLQWCLGSAPTAVFIVGDLRQEYAALCDERGRLIARLWYWREVAAVGSRYDEHCRWGCCSVRNALDLASR